MTSSYQNYSVDLLLFARYHNATHKYYYYTSTTRSIRQVSPQPNMAKVEDTARMNAVNTSRSLHWLFPLVGAIFPDPPMAHPYSSFKCQPTEHPLRSPHLPSSSLPFLPLSDPLQCYLFLTSFVITCFCLQGLYSLFLKFNVPTNHQGILLKSRLEWAGNSHF